MNARGALVGIVLGAGFVAGAMYLLGVEFSDGSVYPEYSSLRSDPVGAKLLFDTLAHVPGMNVSRAYLPLEYLAGSGTTVLLLGSKPASLDVRFLRRVEQLAGRGNRVVAAMSEEGFTPDKSDALEKTWHVRLGYDAKASAGFQLYFTEAKNWKTLEQVGQKARVIERTLGKGSIALFADSSVFGNAAIAAEGDGSFPDIASAIGPNLRVVFDEQHFGITQTGSVVGLVRRFRLTGMALGFAILASLFIWRNVTSFPPPGSEQGTEPETARLAGRTSRSGLLTLLRRHVPPSELASVCWKEWQSVNRRMIPPGGAARVEEAIRSAGSRPVEALREIQSILNSKGTL